MAKKTWKKFPHPDKSFAYAGAALEKHWARLHRGDCEPFPDDDAAQDAWRAYHAGDFAKAVEIGLAAGPSGINAANNTATSENRVKQKADLKVTKFGKNDGAVRAAEILTYTVIVDNLGPSWADNAAIKDVLQTSGKFELLTAPRVAIASQWPVRSTSFGSVWYLLDHQLSLRNSPINVQDLGSVDLRKYNVLILPDSGGLERVLSDGTVEKIKRWVQSGGTLIAIGGSAAFATAMILVIISDYGYLTMLFSNKVHYL